MTKFETNKHLRFMSIGVSFYLKKKQKEYGISPCCGHLITQEKMSSFHTAQIASYKPCPC